MPDMNVKSRPIEDSLEAMEVPGGCLGGDTATPSLMAGVTVGPSCWSQLGRRV
jgi:hypothetical protein